MRHVFFYCVGLLLVFSNIFSEENNEIENLNTYELAVLIESYDPVILKVEENKIFIKNENIHPTKSGLLLEASNKYYRIQELHSCSEGCYIDFSKSDQLNIIFIKCSNCGRKFSPNPFTGSRCPSCQVVN